MSAIDELRPTSATAESQNSNGFLKAAAGGGKPAFRRCKGVWIKGTRVGVTFDEALSGASRRIVTNNFEDA
jgi:hypothetical protein